MCKKCNNENRPSIHVIKLSDVQSVPGGTAALEVFLKTLDSTTPNDQGATPNDQGATPDDQGATPDDQGATPDEPESTPDFYTVHTLEGAPIKLYLSQKQIECYPGLIVIIDPSTQTSFVISRSLQPFAAFDLAIQPYDFDVLRQTIVNS